MKPVLDEATAMAVLVLNARRELAQTEAVTAGSSARLTLTNSEGEQRRFFVPFRVAAYARKVMGPPAMTAKEPLKVVFTSKGITVAFALTCEQYFTIADVLIARLCGEQRRDKRAVRQHNAKLKKGGTSL